MCSIFPMSDNESGSKRDRSDDDEYDFYDDGDRPAKRARASDMLSNHEDGNVNTNNGTAPPSVTLRKAAANRAQNRSCAAIVDVGLAFSNEEIEEAEANGVELGDPPRESAKTKPTAGEREILAVFTRNATDHDKFAKLHMKRRDLPFPSVQPPSSMKLLDAFYQDEVRVEQEFGKNRPCPFCVGNVSGYITNEEVAVDVGKTFWDTQMQSGDMVAASTVSEKFNREVVDETNANYENLPPAIKSTRARIAPVTPLGVIEHVYEHVSNDFEAWRRRALQQNSEKSSLHLKNGTYRISASDPNGETYISEPDQKLSRALLDEAAMLHKLAPEQKTKVGAAMTFDEVNGVLATSRFSTDRLATALLTPFMGFKMK